LSAVKVKFEVAVHRAPSSSSTSTSTECGPIGFFSPAGTAAYQVNSPVERRSLQCPRSIRYRAETGASVVS
jgi:hypothetical protein